MQNTGVMQRVEEQLLQGKSSRNLIGMGYAPGTVYKVQRRMRKRNIVQTQDPCATPEGENSMGQTDHGIPSGQEGEELASLRADLTTFRQEVTLLGEAVEENSQLKEQLDQLRQQAELSRHEASARAEVSDRVSAQEAVIDQLAERFAGLEQTSFLMGFLLYHLDIHHRKITHDSKTDIDDFEVSLTDEGYWDVQKQMRDSLARVVHLPAVKKQYKSGLPRSN